MWLLLMCAITGNYDMVGSAKAEAESEYPKVWVYVIPDERKSWEMLGQFEETAGWKLYWTEYQDWTLPLETTPVVTVQKSEGECRTWVGFVTPAEVQEYLDMKEEEPIMEEEETLPDVPSADIDVPPPSKEEEPVEEEPEPVEEELAEEELVEEEPVEEEPVSQAAVLPARERYVLYVYTLPGCVPCQLLKQELDAQSELPVQYYAYPVNFTDGTRVQKFPSMELFCGSKMIHRYIGYIPVDVIRRDMENHEAGSVR